MAVPKKRNTKSRRDKKRMHIYLDHPALTDCSNCGAKVLRHHMCQNCGFYNGKQVVDVMGDLVENKKKKGEDQEKKEEIKKGPLNMENLSAK